MTHAVRAPAYVAYGTLDDATVLIARSV